MCVPGPHFECSKKGDGHLPGLSLQVRDWATWTRPMAHGFCTAWRRVALGLAGSDPAAALLRPLPLPHETGGQSSPLPWMETRGPLGSAGEPRLSQAQDARLGSSPPWRAAMSLMCHVRVHMRVHMCVEGHGTWKPFTLRRQALSPRPAQGPGCPAAAPTGR